MSHGGGPADRPTVLDWFIHSEVAGSVILLVGTVAALLWANSPWADAYHHLVHTKISVTVGASVFALSLQHWINDGLMVIFFFVVGLEIKRELSVGHLASVRRAIGESRVLAYGASGSRPDPDDAADWVYIRWGDSVKAFVHTPYRPGGEGNDQRLSRLTAEVLGVPLREVVEEPAERWGEVPEAWRR